MTQELQEMFVILAGVGLGLWIALSITRTFFGSKILHSLLQRGHVRLAMRLRRHLMPDLHD